jgi:hypothetical protein
LPQYNVRVSSSNYAKYYFHLRSMCARLGLRGGVGQETSPLNIADAIKIQVVSTGFEDKDADGKGKEARRRCNTVAGEEEADKLEALHKEGYQFTSGLKQPQMSLEQITRPHQTKAGQST